MREIKFRVWWKNQMRYNSIVGNGNAMFIPNATGEYKQISLAECEAEQFTGLKDRNGKEIYEGDIVAFNRGGVLRKEVIEFRCYSFTVGLSLNFYLHELEDVFEDFEVIGNIHENKDILK